MAERCPATTQAGRPCAAKPRPGSAWCAWHDPALAERRIEWSAKGGAQRSHQARLAKRLPAGVMSLEEVTGLVGTALVAVVAGTLDPGRAGAVAQLARAYAQLAQQARLTISLAEAEALVGAFVDAVLASDPTDELRARIAEEFERRLPLPSA
jgi:hypothetical protein